MAKSPFREERLPASEVRRIVTRALDLAPLHDPEATSGQALTRRELEQRAADLGIPLAAVRHALESPSTTTHTASRTGKAVHLVHDEEFEGELTVDGHEDAADAIQSAMEGHRGRLEVVGKRLTYRVTAYGDAVTVTVHTRNGRTRLRVEQTAHTTRRIVLLTLVMLPVAVLPAALAFAATQSWLAAVAMAAVVIASLHLGLRALLGAAARRRAALAERATGAMRGAIRQAVAATKPARVEPGEPVRIGAIDGARREQPVDQRAEAEALAFEDAAPANQVIRRAR